MTYEQKKAKLPVAISEKKSRREILLGKQAKIAAELRELDRKEEARKKREMEQDRKKLFLFIEVEGLGSVPLKVWQDWILESKEILLQKTAEEAAAPEPVTR
jgi:hypothetical protein